MVAGVTISAASPWQRSLVGEPESWHPWHLRGANCGWILDLATYSRRIGGPRMVSGTCGHYAPLALAF